MKAAPTPAGQRAWLIDHIAELRAKVDTLTAVKGKGAKAASDAAERLERRVVRLMRSAAVLDRDANEEARRANRLGRSKNPTDRADLILGALDELPIDLVLRIVEEAGRRARARAGEDRADA